jgi:hypothetical protein
MVSASEGGLGQALIGEKIVINHVTVSVSKLLGEGRYISLLLLEREM